MQNLRLFGIALFKKWWALMSCAVFTFVGLYALVFNKSNNWLIATILLCAGSLFLVAAYGAWNEEHKKLNDRDSEIAALAKVNCPIVSVYLWNTIGAGITENLACGFYFRNNGNLPAYEIAVRKFVVGTQAVQSGTLSEIMAQCASEPIPAWLAGVLEAPDKWNLLAAFNKASEAVDSGSPHGRPNFAVTLHIFYRDHRNLWYETVQDLIFVPAIGNFHFEYGSTKQNYLGVNRPEV